MCLVEMGFGVFGLIVVLPLVTTTVVEMESVWKDNFGWKIRCSWELLPDDSLQSVKIYNSFEQFMTYKPLDDGRQRTDQFSLPDKVVIVVCAEIEENGRTGECVLNLELYQPQKEDLTYGCEVSGERPLFRVGKKGIIVPALLQPSAAVIEVVEADPSGRVTLNCSSKGLPAPSLLWTIDDQREPQSFSSSYWNFTSKLWHVWSLLEYTPAQTHHSVVVCTPEVIKSNRTYRGPARIYNSANSIENSTHIIISAVSLLLLLRRS